MSILHLSLLLAWGTVITVWSVLLFAQFAARREGLLLERGYDARSAGPPLAGPLPSVCVIIAARNEADNLPICLKSVLDQDHPEFSIVVVDDRSDDNTADIVRAWSERDPRITLERVTALPPGWLGKSNALWQGAHRVTADWLLFLDADCVLEPWAVRVAIDEALRREADLFSVWPRQSAGTFWEHMTIPLCAGIIALWFGSPRVNEPASRSAFANGQFLLIRRDAYQRIDGHRAVRDALIEDVPLAEHAKRAGLRCWVSGGRDLVSVRMYHDLKSILEGWARIYVGALRSGVKIALGVLWLVIGSLWPFVAVLLTLGAGFMPATHPSEPSPFLTPTWIGMCLSHLVLLVIVSYRFWGMGGCRRVYLWLYPVSTVVVIAILLRAGWWLTVKRRVQWRGVWYAIDRRGRIRLPATPTRTGDLSS